MKALFYHSPKDVQIDDKPLSNIQNLEDVILRVTSTAICGSHLHLYHRTVPGTQSGRTLGHEFMGIVEEEEEEVGPEVHEVKKGGN
jgi:threonine dehydrogenase-like Zn-dependent dehydrogenase